MSYVIHQHLGLLKKSDASISKSPITSECGLPSFERTLLLQALGVVHALFYLSHTGNLREIFCCP